MPGCPTWATLGAVRSMAGQTVGSSRVVLLSSPGWIWRGPFGVTSAESQMASEAHRCSREGGCKPRRFERITTCR